MQQIFTGKDYNSHSGIMTSIWGPPAWHFLHCISFNYPVKPDKHQKKDYYNYVINMGKILPCKYCRENFKNNVKKSGFTYKSMENRETFSKAMYDLHENVNEMLGKKSNISYEDVKDRYELFRSRCIDQPDEIQIYEKGCTEPVYKGKKSKCVLKIVPKTDKCESITINPQCMLKKIKKSSKKKNNPKKTKTQSGKKKSGKKKSGKKKSGKKEI